MGILISEPWRTALSNCFSRNAREVSFVRSVKYQRSDLIRCKEMDGVRSGTEERVRVLGAEAAEREARAHGVERELRLEREWRTSLQEASISSAEKISQLHQEIDQLRRVSEVRSVSLSTFLCFICIQGVPQLALVNPELVISNGNGKLKMWCET